MDPGSTSRSLGGVQPSWTSASGREERLKCARDAFVRVDKDGSGTIDVGELENLLNLAGLYPTAAELDVLYKRFDKDADGSISFEEFIEAMVEDWEEQEIEEEFAEIRELFSQLDKDGSGRLSVDELKNLIRILGVEVRGDMEGRVVEKLFQGMTRTGSRAEGDEGDGVSIDQFAAFLLSQDEDRGKEHCDWVSG